MLRRHSQRCADADIFALYVRPRLQLFNDRCLQTVGIWSYQHSHELQKFSVKGMRTLWAIQITEQLVDSKIQVENQSSLSKRITRIAQFTTLEGHSCPAIRVCSYMYKVACTSVCGLVKSLPHITGHSLPPTPNTTHQKKFALNCDQREIKISNRVINAIKKLIAEQPLSQSKRMRMFCPLRQMAAPVGRRTTLFGRDRQVAAPGKSAVSDYILLWVVTRASKENRWDD